MTERKLSQKIVISPAAMSYERALEIAMGVLSSGVEASNSTDKKIVELHADLLGDVQIGRLVGLSERQVRHRRKVLRLGYNPPLEFQK